MLKQLNDILNGKENNYLLPFYWQRGNHYDKIPEQIQLIYDSGARAFCVESRPHCDFAGPIWWKDMDLILSEAKKRDMKVWILDDDHFPTGHANGLVKKKYPQYRKWNLIEDHMDVVGFAPESTLLLQTTANDENILLGAYAYKRADKDQDVYDNPVDITEFVDGDRITWDVPEGLWRIFTFWKSRKGSQSDEYISMLDPNAVDVLIEAVYEPHYEHYKDYFGSTIAGFFSDEPAFCNDWYGSHSKDFGMYNKRVGMQGLALPFDDKVIPMMEESLGRNPIPYLAALWFGMVGEKDITGKVRYAYMDAVTKLYSQNFNYRLGNWSRAHGVEYIGHIIEDMNAHARLSCSAGHYFRATEGQDMAGMDIVLHQIMPGMNKIHTASCFGNDHDPDFFNCVLGDMCGSMAQLYPQMKGRAMCEVFGAFGWAEGSPFMKWLMDYLLVRGVNHFVPHAFSPVFPNLDCPPHFGVEGQDPQFEGFTAIMKYSNKVAHLLCGANHIVDYAIFYHGESEWTNDIGNAETMNTVARQLSDNGFSYEILPNDVIAGKVGKYDKNRYKAIIVPYSVILPDEVKTALKNCGTKVIFVDIRPDGCDFGDVIALNDLHYRLEKNIVLSTYEPELRYYLCERDGAKILMFFNGDVSKEVNSVAKLPFEGSYCKLDMLNGKKCGGKSNGALRLNLSPYQSVIYIFDGEDYGNDDVKAEYEKQTVNATYKIEKANSEKLKDFSFYTETDKLFNMTAKNREPDFAGKLRYTFTVNCDKKPDVIDFGYIGQDISLSVNGKDLGIRVCQPYSFDISDVAKEGENTFVATVSSTLALREKDGLSTFMQITPTGILAAPIMKFKK